jgi:hypothetical protein
MPEWSGKLRTLYWFLRYHRKWSEAKRRQIYRQIAAEKKRLSETGVDSELVRLYCRYLANTKNRHAEARYLMYQRQGRLFDGLFNIPDDFT